MKDIDLHIIYFGRQTQTTSHPSGWLFYLAAALVASKLAPQAKRRRIRFAFSRICCRGDSRIARFSFEIVLFGRSKPLPYGLVASKLAPQAKRRGIRFAFAARSFGRGAPWCSRFLMSAWVFSGGASPSPTARQSVRITERSGVTPVPKTDSRGSEAARAQ